MDSTVIDSRLRTRESLLVIFGGMAGLVILSLPHLGDPLIVDEAIFGSTIRSLAESGIPHYYAGESVGSKSGLWHPPTYIYYVSVWFSTLGVSSFVARLATFVFTVLTVPAVARLSLTMSDATGGRRWKTAMLAAVTLYVTAPLVVQNGTLVDIDGSILGLAVTVFAAWVVKTFESGVERWARALTEVGAWFACLAWIKFGALPVLLLGTVLYVGHHHGVRRSIHVCVAVGAGIVAFVVSWAAVSGLLDLSFVQPFAHNFGALFKGGAAVSTEKRLLLSTWGLYTEIAWFSPFLLGLGALGVIERHRHVQPAPAFAYGIALLTLLQYTVLAKVPYGFPKYLGIATPLVCAVAGIAVANAQMSLSDDRRWAILGLTTVAVSIGMYLLGDPYLVPFDDGYAAVVMETARTIGGVLVLMAVAGFALYRARWTPTYRHLVVALLVVMLVGTNGGILVHQTTADYSTRYFYGVDGTDDAIQATIDAYEDVPSDRQGTSVIPVDFGFYVDGQFHAARRYTVAEFEADKPPLVVLRTQEYYAVESELLEALKISPEYESRQYGSYLVFERTV